MTLLTEYGNETMSAAHIHAKMASKEYFTTKFNNSIKSGGFGDFERGYISIQKSDFDVLKIMSDHPKLMVAIFITDQINPSPLDFFQDTVIPSSSSFFLVVVSKYSTGFLSENVALVQGKCFRLYKPAQNLTTKIFPLMFYGGLNEKKWYWQDKNTDWNSYTKDILNMSQITVTIALATPREKNVALRKFFKHKNSFFWRAMAEFLKFRTVVHVEQVSPQAVKNMTSVYLRLLMTVADGLGVLPVMSSERNHHSLKCLVTGVDSKYHLLVRAPQYIHSWQSTLKPFALQSWLCLGLSILLISLILKIVTCGEKSEDTNPSCCFLMIFGFICSQGSPNIPKEMSARLVCYTALLFSILIYQFYTSNFCSLLSTKEVSLPFNSLEQLIAKQTHSLYVHPDTAIYAHILKAKSGVFKKLFDEILKKDPFHQLKSDNREKALGKVCKGTGAILGLPFQTLDLNELSCTLIPVNSGYFPTSVVTAIRRTFPFQSQFKFVHLRLLESGVTHKFRDEFLSFKKQRATKTEVSNEPVSLNHVAFLFVFYATFIVLSFLVFCFEIVFFGSLKKTSKHFLNGNLFLRRKQFH